MMANLANPEKAASQKTTSQKTASLFRLGRLLSPGPTFNVYLPEAANRHQVTQYIADQFKAVHGAHIHDFMPLLLSMQCQGRISAVTGVRPAARQSLFLEQYLDSQVQAVLTKLTASEVKRNKIVEVGNLVATQKGASQLLFLLLTALLHRCGYEWVVFTATPIVIKGLERLGFKLDVLCDADPARLENANLAEWGTYYSNRPQVVAGFIPPAMKVLSEHKVLSGVLALLGQQISELAPVFAKTDLPYGTHAVTA